MIVLDASVAVNALIPGPLRGLALTEINADELAAPALIDAEVLSALARLERAQHLSDAEATAALEVWSTVPVERFELAPFAPQVWGLRQGVQIADAFYVALARNLACTLVTSDGKLARAGIPGLDIRLIA